MQPIERKHKGGRIVRVDPDGLGRQVGLCPGDLVVRVNGYKLRDVIDFRFYTAEAEVEFDIQREGRQLVLAGSRQYGQPIGVEFTHPTFDVDIRRCVNRCDFCFVTQSPPGMRRTLYVKDDDYRYSFLFGHYVTLTNLKQADWERFDEQYISPLYVSIHATEVGLRRKLLGRDNIPDVMEQLRRLQQLHIQVHTQLVLLPGVNDGVHLERSLQDLVNLYPTVQSVSIVPVGLTHHYTGNIRSYLTDEAQLVLDQVEPWRMRCRTEFGATLVYPSDEWYLLARRPIPPAVEYDGFGQVENGVGMLRQFLEEWQEVKAHIVSVGAELTARRVKHRNVTMVCGELAAPVLHRVVDELNELVDASMRVLPVVNRWYGTVNVSGLLTGRDVIQQVLEQIAERSPDFQPLRMDEVVLLPRSMFDNAGQITLDDKTPAQIQAALNVPLFVVDSPGQILAALCGELPTFRTDCEPPAVPAKPGWWGQQDRPFWQGERTNQS